MFNKTSVVGFFITLVEWIEYSIFGHFATEISATFMPTDDTLISQKLGLMYVYLIFFIGFIFRPIGSFLFSKFSVRNGNGSALLLSLFIISTASLLIGLMPGYEIIGTTAPIVLICIRVIHGIAIGGSYGGSFVFVIDNAVQSRKAMSASLCAMGVLSGLLLGSVIASLSSYLKVIDAIGDNYWRIPYIVLYIFVLIMIIYIFKNKDLRYSLSKGIINESKRVTDVVLEKVFIISVIKSIGIILLDAIGIYVIFFLFVNFINQNYGISKENLLWINSFNMCVMVIFIPFFGSMSDKYGSKIFLYTTGTAYIVCSIPCFYWIDNMQTITSVFVTQLIFAISLSMCYGSLPYYIYSVFKPVNRYTGNTLSFNICMGIFGGSAPFLVFYIVDKTGILLTPAILLTISGFVALLSLSVSNQYCELHNK